MEFSRPEYWSGQPFPSPGDLLNPGSNPGLLHCRQILYELSHQGSPSLTIGNFSHHFMFLKTFALLFLTMRFSRLILYNVSNLSHL